MNYKFYLLSILSLALMVSCQENAYDLDNTQVNSNIILTASLDEANDTRTQLTADNNGYKVLWSENDLLSVFSSETAHAKFALKSGAGQANADFSFVGGELNFGTEAGSNNFNYVGVYPYSENTTVAKSGDDYVINTEIPTTQSYSVNSFGQDASPMVAIHPSLKFSFKNIGSILIMPLKGAGVITYATLESKSHKIAGSAIVTAEANNNWVPTVDVENGESKIVLSCGDGVELDAETATNFFFVLAPGTYEANDLVVTFNDSYGNFFTTEITAKNTFARSKSLTFGARTFEVTGVNEIDLYIKANAAAYMEAERIIPSVNDINIEGWVNNLKNQENARALIEEAIGYITLKNYKGAYEVLGGVPGFKKETIRLESTGSYIQKVDYTGAGYLKSMLEEIETINDIPSLLQYMKDFEKIYEASGVKNKLDETLGNFSDSIDAYIDAFVDSLVTEKPEDNLSEEEALAIYMETVKTQLKESIDSVKSSINVIATINKIPFCGSLFADEKSSLQTYLNAAQVVYDNFDTYTTKSAVEAAINTIPAIEIYINFRVYVVDEKIDPKTFLTGAEKDYTESLKEQIAQNQTAINLTKAALKSAIGELKGASIVESLEKVVNEPDSTTAKFLNYLFSQEAFMDTVKSTLRDIVTEIEEASKEAINNGNIGSRDTAIAVAVENAIINARVVAIDNLNNDFDLTNQTNINNLNNSAWGLFQKVLKWQKCVELFSELGILDVYNALIELGNLVEQMITYDKGSIYYNIKEIGDYQENIDWWILTFNESLE